MPEQSWGDAHRALLQVLMARGSMTLEEGTTLLKEISGQGHGESTEADASESTWKAYINAMNAIIEPYDLEIRSTLHQTSRERIWALVNCSSDAFTQLATLRTAGEMAFVKRLLDAMFETHNTERHEVMAITSMQAMSLAKGGARRSTQAQEAEVEGEEPAATQQSVSLLQAEKVLQSLVDEGWFEQSRKGYYSLSPRGLMELRGWLQDTYNDEDTIQIKSCHACKDIVTIRLCLCRMHESCTQRLFGNQNEKRCPVCRTAWTMESFVGEKAAIAAKNSVRRRSGPATNGEANGEAEGSSEDE